MKNLFLAIIVLVFAIPIFAQSGIVEVTITGIENTDGTIKIGIYDSKSSFPTSGKEIQGAKVKPTKTGSLDKKFGIPKENYGFSKNIFGFFGPPDFEDVSFKVVNGIVIKLTINLE